MANLRVDKITSTETFETTGSVQFDGAGDCLTAPDGSDFEFGSDNFTIEAYIYYTGSPGTSGDTYAITSKWDNQSAPNDKGFILRISDDGSGDNLQWYYTTNGSTNKLTTGSTVLNPNTWYHIAFVRNENIGTFYIDGTADATTVSFGSDSIRDTGNPFRIGANLESGSVDQEFRGHISNVRVVKGRALYTENFKPSMRELEVVPGTVLLACQSKTDASLEKTGKTVTVVAQAVASELTPGILTPVPKDGAGSAITGSVEFTSTTDALVLSAGEDFAYGTGDFTIEAWIQPQGTASGETKAIFTQTQSGNDYIVFKVDSDKAIKATFGSTTVSGGTVEVGSWHHVAVTRASNTVKIFVNGVGSSGTTVSTDFSDTTRNPTIGQYTHTYGNIEYYGFISNLRVVKGTALYTHDFIPPTRELKKVPGTVLLCCQDPDNPLTEATGKTITGYGDLSPGGGSNLVSNAYDADAPGDTTGWSTDQGASLSVSSDRLRVTNGSSDYGIAQTSVTTLTGQRYVVRADFHPGTANQGELRASNTSFSNTLGGTGLNASSPKSLTFTAASTTTYINVYGSNASGEYSEWANFSVTLAEGSSKGSNFTPQVGDDRKVTFEGVTKVNTDAYFYLPTGDTTSRETTGTYNAGTRGIFGGGFIGPSAGSQRDTIQYINIATTGNAVDAGDLTQARYGNAALASDTRAVWAGGTNPSPATYNIIDAVEIMSTGNAFDFGDLYATVYYPGGVSNRTRGIYTGGYNPSDAPSGFKNNIGYITISSKGDTQDFGDLITARNSFATFNSPTRGCFAGGASPSKINTIEYVTIATTGNASDFGDLTVARNYAGGCGSAIRGLVGGGSDPSAVNTIDYVTISAMGNAADFGDLTSARQEIGACSSATRGVFVGSWSPAKTNIMDYVTIQTTANAKDFGDLVNIGVMQECGTSNGHGGLG